MSALRLSPRSFVLIFLSYFCRCLPPRRSLKSKKSRSEMECTSGVCRPDASERTIMYFGVDYHPEQWVYPYGGTAENPEAAWQRDVELMASAGINVVRIGEFTWGLCEREEGKYEFSWLGRVKGMLGKAGDL